MNPLIEERYRNEMLNGKIISMSPRSTVNHNLVSGNLYGIFRNFLRGNLCTVFPDGTKIFLSDKDRVVPDMAVICNPSIIQMDGIHGAPNLVVEVLSPSTAKNDRGYKMELYAKSGIAEYWIVDPLNHFLEIYLLEGDVYKLENIYTFFPEHEIIEMTEEEKEELVVTDFSTPLFPDLQIPIHEVFEKTISYR
ncbi:MAG: Uma2 family endonuclease [Turicibacter sp.]|nr:Uma2 family endonuclease [Turicibacter sp.]